jgi:hypothetical protein
MWERRINAKAPDYEYALSAGSKELEKRTTHRDLDL